MLPGLEHLPFRVRALNFNLFCKKSKVKESHAILRSIRLEKKKVEVKRGGAGACVHAHI